MSAELSKHLKELPEPPKENLTSHFILGEIIDHIHFLQDEFPLVKIPLLREHLWSIRNKSVDPEDHLRGFLKVFEHTPVFKDAFEQLDEGMKRQMKAFMAGGNEGPVMASGLHGEEFHLPASPPVKHHFQEIREFVEKVENFFHPDQDKKQINGTNGVKDVKVEQITADGGLPQIFENTEKTKIMEVRDFFLLSSFLRFRIIWLHFWGS